MWLTRVFDRIEQTQITFFSWFTAFLGISFIRVFLENLSSQSLGGIATTDVSTIIHYILFYLPTLLALILVVHFFSRRDVALVSRVALFGFLIIWTPPLIDLVFTGGDGHQISYLFEPGSQLLENFLTFFGAQTISQVTIGLRLELIIIFGIIFAYVFTCTKSIFRSVGSVLIAYVVLFILAALPSFFQIGSPIWFADVKTSLLAQNLFHPMVAFIPPYVRGFEMYFNGAMSHVLYLITLPLLFLFFLRLELKKTFSILANSRFERVSHYLIMILLGIFLAWTEGVGRPLGHWLDYTSILLLLLSFYFAWMYAVGVNDIIDEPGDRISNTGRPLVTRAVNLQDMRVTNLVFLMAALLGGYLAGHYAFFMILGYIAISHVYSVPPLHLKRFAVINPFLIALASLTAMFAGFFTISGDPRFDAFPKEWILLIVVTYTLFANVKDIKDVEGDRAAGVWTLPVLFGKERGKQVIGALVVCALAAIPLISGFTELWYVFVPFALLSYFFVTKEPFVERHVFILYFLYILLCVLAILYL